MARLETGPIQEDGDWPGVFIRGDNARTGYVPALAAVLKGNANPIHRAQCEGILKLLRSADADSVVTPQKVRRIASG